MSYNSSLYLTMADQLRGWGLQQAGYRLISAGGSTYPHQGIPPWNSTNSTNRRNVIVRDQRGVYQVDPARFPGPGSSPDCLNQTRLRGCLAANQGDPASCGCRNGNAGMQSMVGQLRAMGFQWGSYSNEAGCEVPACAGLNASRFRGFVDQDFDLMVTKWRSDYIMVDSVGSFSGPPDRPYPKSDPRWAGWNKYLLSLWSQKLSSTPVILHSCHNGCASPFSGPTLRTAECNASQPSQRWQFGEASPGPLRDAGPGLCVGCGSFFSGACANDALHLPNGSGSGMQACSGGQNQQWQRQSDTRMLRRADGSCLELLAGLPGRPVVVRPGSACNGSASQRFSPRAAGAGYAQLASAGQPGQCLAVGPTVRYRLDDWCWQNNNMWRSSTDTLQTWNRVMVQLDSLVGLGPVSGPGQWGFADSLELGVPGRGVLTWEESKSHLALYAVCSQPLFISNDLRPGYVQPRLVQLLLNRDMLAVNQQFAGFAGDRMWTSAVGIELWAKPLPELRAGLVLFNRNGTTSQCDAPAGIEHQGSLAIPCDDDPAHSVGAQDITLRFGVLPEAWLVDLTSKSGGPISCKIRDIFSGPNGTTSEDLGWFEGEFVARRVPPHGSRFLLLSNCTS